MVKIKLFGLVSLAVIFSLLPSCAIQEQSKMILDKPLTMKVYRAEILESVINRLCVDTIQYIKYSTIMLLPYQAKAREYRNITVREILNDQLKGTPIKYQLLNNKLVLYNAETSDYSTNMVKVIKR